MAFNNRWICKYDENISYNQIKKNIESNEYFVDVTAENTLQHRIDVLGEYTSESLNFIYGKYGYEYETRAITAEITPERIIDRGDLTVKTAVISFWIADNHKILFSLKDEKSKNRFAENLLDGESSIQNLEVDIKKMQDASTEGKLSDLWAASFENRDSNIRTGQLYGSNVMEDPIFSETADATQKLAGIIIDSEDKKIKMKLYKDGGMQIYGSHLEPLDPFIFDVIDELNEYIG